MTHRSRAASRVAAAIVLGAMLVAALAGSAAAADTITIQARAMVGGRFEAGGWAALSIRLANDGPPVTGYLAAEGEDGTVRRFVELPAGSRKEVTLYLRPASFARAIVVRLESSDGTEPAAEAEVRVLERTTGHVAVVGDGGGNLRPQLIARATGLPDPIPMTAADLPDRPEPLRGIETIVWAADSSGLREAQRRSLERWIAAGGQLVVLGGPDWQARAAAFAELLPVEGLAAVDDASPAPLADWVGSPPPPGVATLTASVGTLRNGGVALVSSDDGALFAAISRGAGRVGWLGFDLATEPFRAWPGAAALWSRVVPDDRLEVQMIGPGPAEDEVANTMTQALANLPALEVPPAELLLAVIIGYILLIGPVSYVVLRRLDRRELAWVTAPILVLVFSAGSYGIGASMKGSEVIVNEIAILRSTTGGTAASVSSFAGIFSPTRSTYDLTVHGDALFSALRNTFDPGLAAPVTHATEQGDPSHLRGLSVSVFGLQAVRAETVVPYTPNLHVDWSFGVGVIEGTVTNDGTTAVEDVAVITRSGGVLVGTLAPGASEAFTLSVRNPGGSLASEMVYGFANSNATSAAERQEQIRRQVIDSLVGYGSGWPVRFGNAGGGIDRGPFVIGWQTDASPVPVEIDGHEVQRYGQAVEVLSGQPTLGPGAVSLEPVQMATEVASIAGEANASEPGYVTLADGEVVFRVSLPLEASGLVATKVTLVAANDASSIFLNQGAQASLMPPGYRLSVFDSVAGDWIDVGDLSQRVRFEMDDPARVMDPAGRILVRISASDVPAENGQMPVYASAAVEGVI
jgi:hypothetical protein